MKLIKFVQIIALAVTVQGAQADFLCQGAEELQVQVHHLKPMPKSSLQKQYANFTLLLGKNMVFQSTAEYSQKQTRVGIYHSYNIPNEAVNFQVSGVSNLMPTQPGCHPHSRLTCDYQYVETYQGYLYYGGNNYVLSCQNI